MGTERGAGPALYVDSRRLLGPSLWLDAPGVVLDAPAPHGHHEGLLRAWAARVTWMCAAMGWPDTGLSVRRHAQGATLAFTAPAECLMSATSLNEWCLQSAADELGVVYDAATLEEERLPDDQAEALATLREFTARERAEPPEDASPVAPRDIPIALVTGSNGKTTTTRLLVAMLRAAGHQVGYCCTDGVYVDEEALERGDWSGPQGARRVLQEPRVTAAVLETARGGLLRRGLVVPHADVAVVTNVAADHLGEYGVDSVHDVAAAKLVVAKALRATGTLVLNGEDPTLRASAAELSANVQWFDGSNPLLPPAAELPIALGGAASYNIANAAAAAVAAQALGIAPETITETLRRFGAANQDNPGRLERYKRDGVHIWMDYAHNPHGLQALLSAAATRRGAGRLGLLLGQAGDRSDEALGALARTAWQAEPDRIVLQELEFYRRGRARGEVPRILHRALCAAGAPEERLEFAASEADGVAALLRWAQPGDLLVLPVHALEARGRVQALLGVPPG